MRFHTLFPVRADAIRKIRRNRQSLPRSSPIPTLGRDLSDHRVMVKRVLVGGFQLVARVGFVAGVILLHTVVELWHGLGKLRA